MTRREAIRLLKTEKQVTCLDSKSYLMLLAISIEITGKNLETPVAKIIKGY